MALKQRDVDLAAGLELEGYVIANTEPAFEALPAQDAEHPHCVRCGSPIKHVFLTSKGPMGGDCLATLTGDQSTRRLARKILTNLDRFISWGNKVIALKLYQSPGYRRDYSVWAVYLDHDRYDSWSGRYGERDEYLSSFSEQQLPVVHALLTQEAESRGIALRFDLQPSP